jgi:acylphosphatase
VTRAHVSVRGRVQGVSFRLETQARARQLGVAGWVRNVPDGSVEAVFEGDEEDVRRMVEWCRRGPRAAHVTSVDVRWEDARAEAGFRVLP